MDDIDIGFQVLVYVMGILALIFIGALIYDSLFVYPIATEDAMQQCEQKGFDAYDTFEHALLSSKALGVKCKYINIGGR